MRRLVVTVLLGSIALVGAAVPAAAGSPSLGDVDVPGFGKEPTLEFSKPFSTKTTVRREVTKGDGEELKKGTKVSINYVVVDGRTGAEIENSFEDGPAVIVLDKKQATPGIVKGLIGASVGSRVLIAIAPKEGLAAGVDVPGVQESDTLLFVADVVDTRDPLDRAEGDAVPPVEGLPTVKLSKKGKPTITVPAAAAAPTELVVQPLIVGDGPVVEAGQTITAHYTGVIWGGDEFDSSWKRAAPADFVVGSGQLIAGWDEGLVGQTVGSQVLLVIPADKGYGESGNPSAGIAGTDTLVFVVDILDAF